jgi:class 3 adenylate cyclase/ABC-type transport system involved in cytochrome c biogenesis ATPase subunit
MATFAEWLAGIGLQQYEALFTAHDVDLGVAPDITESDLVALGLSLGHRRRFLAAAAALKRKGADAEAGASHISPAPASNAPLERRPVTVVFLDLVGSTALANRLDPEDMKALLERYREAAGAAVRRHEGHVAQYLGDGLLCYFGYPQAQEDAAERAVRAALEAVRSVTRLQAPDGAPLASRAGIASGVVAAPAHAGTEQTVVGDVPNLAARLQTLAAPSEVVVGAITRELTGTFFEFEPLGSVELKGYAVPQEAWRVRSERPVVSRFAGARNAATPLVGREREIAYLADAWGRAQAGSGHVVMVGGEPGIGKSRLLEAMAERVRVDGARVLRCQCSPYHRNSALHPFAQLVAHAAGLRAADSASSRLAAARAWLAALGRTDKVARALIADLLELEGEEPLAAVEMTAAQRKSETLALLQAFMFAAADRPTLLLFEDAHWIDPTSNLLLEQLLGRIDQRPLLALVSHRPEGLPGWHRHANASALACNPLGQQTCTSLVRTLMAAQALDEAEVAEIVQRGDGVPLFVEELTKAVLALGRDGARAVPATLRDSLMARLDRMGEARGVLQVAAVIGREFDAGTLGALADLEPVPVAAALGRLQEAGLVRVLGERGGWLFHHALVQEEAYESLSTARRRELHARHATLLESAGGAPPELLAQHHAAAGAAARATALWIEAASRSRLRCAFSEALAHLHAALDEARRIADAQASAALALEAQLLLAATLLMQRGPHVPEVAEALGVAHDRATARGDDRALFQASWGLYINAASNLRLDAARDYGEELSVISARLGDNDLEMEALHHRWGICYFTGDLAGMMKHTSDGVARYDPSRHHRFAHVFAGHDSGVCAHVVGSIGWAMCGCGSPMRERALAGVQLAESLDHPVTLAFSLLNAALASCIVGDRAGAARHVERLGAVADRYDFAAQRSVAGFLRALALAEERGAAATADELVRDFDGTRTQGFLALFPVAALAEGLAKAGRREEAARLLDDTLDRLPDARRGIWVSELWRVRGEVRGGESGAADLRVSYDIATAQGAALYRLRAALALAAWQLEHRRREDAARLLAEAGLGAGVDEGLAERRLLDELRSAAGAF